MVIMNSDSENNPSYKIDLKKIPADNLPKGKQSATALKVFGIISIIGGILSVFTGLADNVPIISFYGLLGIMNGVFFIAVSNIVKLLMNIVIKLSR